MVDIGINQPIAIPLPKATPPAASGQTGSPIPQPPAPQVALPGSGNTSDQSTYDPQSIEQKRAAAVQAASQQAADTFVVSDKEFTIFKDETGQYITRFTSLRDGKVTYIPEPAIFSLGGPTSSNSEPLVQIKA